MLGWRHQTITWTNVDLSPKVFCGIHLRAFSLEELKIIIYEMSLKNTLVKLQSHLTGLSICVYIFARKCTQNGNKKYCCDILLLLCTIFWTHKLSSWFSSYFSIFNISKLAIKHHKYVTGTCILYGMNKERKNVLIYIYRIMIFSV